MSKLSRVDLAYGRSKALPSWRVRLECSGRRSYTPSRCPHAPGCAPPIRGFAGCKRPGGECVAAFIHPPVADPAFFDHPAPHFPELVLKDGSPEGVGDNIRAVKVFGLIPLLHQNSRMAGWDFNRSAAVFGFQSSFSRFRTRLSSMWMYLSSTAIHFKATCSEAANRFAPQIRNSSGTRRV